MLRLVVSSNSSCINNKVARNVGTMRRLKDIFPNYGTRLIYFSLAPPIFGILCEHMVLHVFSSLEVTMCDAEPGTSTFDLI